MTERLTIDVSGHVATVTLNRPDKYNAIDMAMFEAFAGIAGRIAEKPEIRAVVLTGAGENFCAGIDLSVFQGQDPGAALGDRFEAGANSPANFIQMPAYAWQEIPVPVIAAVRGVAYGGGLQIALGADIRYAAPDARFSVLEVKWGIIPDMGITATALQVVPLDKLKELAFTAKVVSADEAQQYGLVTSVMEDPVAAAQALAAEIANRSPDAVKSVKSLFRRSWNAQDAESLALEAELQKPLLGSANQMEAVMANLQNRPPNFDDD